LRNQSYATTQECIIGLCNVDAIEEAKRIKNWPALETAIDVKMQEQHQFVAWWRAAIQRPGRKWAKK
jgi:hypothetical protein